MDNIRVLQIGPEDWSTIYELPSNVEWKHVSAFVRPSKTPYDIVFWDRNAYQQEIVAFDKSTWANTLFVTEGVKLEPKAKALFEKKKGRILPQNEIAYFLREKLLLFFPMGYGENYGLCNLTIAHHFGGSVAWEGNCGVLLTGSFGKDLEQIAFWRNNIPLQKGQAMDMWLTYEKTGDVEITVSVTQFLSGTISKFQQSWYFTEEDLKEVITLDNEIGDGVIFVSILAKGKGSLRIKALGGRRSRKEFGFYRPGGERYVTSNREEIFCYFDEGDRKPPFNIYFSGYRVNQGFEGAELMHRAGSPYLLISDPRLEGGAFFVGSKEYEELLRSIIWKYITMLDFTNEQVNMMGLSMGAYAALYYACEIRPHALLLGKPLANLGNVAYNERLHRPGGFPTSLDVVKMLANRTDDAAITSLNERLWKRFDVVDWDNTKFIVSYMLEDDYDPDAYSQLMSHLATGKAQLYGKGVHGRHNDNTQAIVLWFMNQFQNVLREDFERELD